MSNDLERRDELRLTVLKHMYDETVGKNRDPGGTIFDAPNIAEVVPFPEQEVASALEFLEGKGLVNGSGVQFIGERRFPRNYNILPSGIDEVEQSLRAPERGTEHFSPSVTQNFYGHVGAVQTGSNATANVTQNIGVDLPSVFSLVEQLKQNVEELPEAEREDASDSLNALDDELKTSKNPSKIRSIWRGLKSFGQGTVTFASQLAELGNQLKDFLGPTST